MITLEGKLTKDRVPSAAAQLAEPEDAGDTIEIDLSRVTEADSAGVALLSVFARRMKAAGRTVRLVRALPEVKKTLALFPYPADDIMRPAAETAGLAAIGERAIRARDVVLEFFFLFADAAYFTIAGLFRRRGIRWDATLFEMSNLGSRALGVVGLIAFLVGATMALQSAAQLRQFGANVFVVDLIGISMTRELGPLMAAIVVAGRSGSAVAAEIGTMVISEELDALRTMGINPTRFLIVPKLIAITLTQPLLTILADTLGILGGFAVASTYLDVSPTAFLSRLESSLYMKDLLTGLVKSVMFAQLIVMVGALSGLRTKGGADAVGRSTTTSVVAGIFAVIVADAAASLFFYFGD